MYNFYFYVAPRKKACNDAADCNRINLNAAEKAPLYNPQKYQGKLFIND